MLKYDLWFQATHRLHQVFRATKIYFLLYKATYRLQKKRLYKPLFIDV